MLRGLIFPKPPVAKSYRRPRKEENGAAWVLFFRGPSRRPIDYNQSGATALVESSLLRRRIAILDAVFVKNVFHQGIRWPIIPSWIVIEVQSDRRNCASANIGASPAAGGGEEFHSDFEIRVFHLGILA